MTKIVAERRGKNILKTRKLFTKYSNCSLDTKPINEPRNESAQKKKGKSLKEYFERWFDKMLETGEFLKSQKLISNLTTAAL